jgi:hypothetical membrane protein
MGSSMARRRIVLRERRMTVVIYLSLIASILVVLGYGTFTTIAFAHFPLAFSPRYNWLSDLGNPDLNPTGAAFYNVGVALAAVALLAFFLGLFRLRQKDSRVQTTMTALTVGFGSVGSLAMLMSAVYPINHPAQHSFWCLILFFSIGTGFAFSVAATRHHARVPGWLLGLGAVVVLVNLTVQIFFHDVCLSEWINVPLLLGYCLLLGIATLRFS